MSETRVEVVGLSTLRATLKVAAHRIEDLNEPSRRTATFLAARGRADAPRRTGRLAASVRGVTEGNTAQTESALVYAGRTHNGWAAVHQQAQPWLAEGRDKTQNVWLDNYEARIDTVLAGVRGA